MTPPTEPNDLTTRALAESLRVSFLLLKAIMLCIALLFALSGVFWVEEGSVALHTRFGRILGRGENAVIEPGGPHLALPSPIDSVINVPTTLQTISIDQSFWYAAGNDGKGEGPNSWSSLVPGRDGFLVTGDKNIVHGQWKISFSVAFDAATGNGLNAPRLFAANVGTTEKAARLVRSAAEQAIIRVVAATDVDDYIQGKLDNKQIRDDLQKTLTALKTGLRVRDISHTEYSVPRQLAHDFQAVNNAQSQKATNIEKAERRKAMILNNTAGSAYPELLKAIDDYEAARSGKNKGRILAAENRIMSIFRHGDVGGMVSEEINDAVSYRTRVVELIKGASERFVQLIDLEKHNPRIFRESMMQDTVQEIFSADVVKLYVPSDETKMIYIDLGLENGPIPPRLPAGALHSRTEKKQ